VVSTPGQGTCFTVWLPAGCAFGTAAIAKKERDHAISNGVTLRCKVPNSSCRS
jgi:hypothetical protein